MVSCRYNETRRHSCTIIYSKYDRMYIIRVYTQRRRKSGVYHAFAFCCCGAGVPFTGTASERRSHRIENSVQKVDSGG